MSQCCVCKSPITKRNPGGYIYAALRSAKITEGVKKHVCKSCMDSGEFAAHIDALELKAGFRKDLPGSPFTLTNAPAKPQLWKAPQQPKARQAVLFSGLDCLAGQEDLFATDGAHAQKNSENSPEQP